LLVSVLLLLRLLLTSMAKSTSGHNPTAQASRGVLIKGGERAFLVAQRAVFQIYPRRENNHIVIYRSRAVRKIKITNSLAPPDLTHGHQVTCPPISVARDLNRTRVPRVQGVGE